MAGLWPDAASTNVMSTTNSEHGLSVQRFLPVHERLDEMDTSLLFCPCPCFHIANETTEVYCTSLYRKHVAECFSSSLTEIGAVVFHCMQCSHAANACCWVMLFWGYDPLICNHPFTEPGHSPVDKPRRRTKPFSNSVPANVR